MIPYGRQTIEEDDIEEVVKVLKSDFLTTGPKVAEFERAVAEYVGAKCGRHFKRYGGTACGMPCGGNRTGDEVITTAGHVCGIRQLCAVLRRNAGFADIDPQTYNIDPEDIRRKITDKTKAIIPVHLAGQPCDMDAIHAIAKSII